MSLGTRRLARITLVVREYDEAIAFYTGQLGFTLLEDTDLGNGKRWVRVAPSPHNGGAELLLGRATTPEQLARVGDQTGGRVFLFLETEAFWDDYATFVGRGVAIARPPNEEPYGTVAVLCDLYGNLIDLIQPSGVSS